MLYDFRYKNGKIFKINLSHSNEYESVEKKQKNDKSRTNSKNSLTNILNSQKNSQENGIKIKENDTQINVNMSMNDAQINVNESTNSAITKMKIVCDEPLKTIKSTTPEISLVYCCNISKLMDASNLEKYYEAFELSNNISKMIEKDENKIAVSNPINLITKCMKQTKYTSIIEIENLYQKYFYKSVKDNIVIIANILNIILLCNEQHIERLKPVNRKQSVVKFKNRCDMMIFFKHKSILECEFNKYFRDIISGFVNSEVELGFKMLFMSVLSVHKRLVQSTLNKNFKRDIYYKNQILLLWNTLKKSGFENDKVFNMINSNSFFSDCIDLINLIEDSQPSDPSITHRLSLFFVTLAHTKSYFQLVIDALGNTLQDIALLLNVAVSQYCINSEFINSLDLYSSSNMKKNLNTKTSVICSTTSEDSVTLVSDKIKNENFK